MSKILEHIVGMEIYQIKGMEEDSEKVEITLSSTGHYGNGVLTLWHEEECCEYVRLIEVIGDPKDLLRSPLTLAEAVSSRKQEEGNDGETWTFYKFATAKGHVTLRWLGQSNGYYSEGVSMRLTITEWA